MLEITRFWDALGPKTASFSLKVTSSKARIFKQPKRVTATSDDVIQFCPIGAAVGGKITKFNFFILRESLFAQGQVCTLVSSVFILVYRVERFLCL